MYRRHFVNFTLIAWITAFITLGASLASAAAAPATPAPATPTPSTSASTSTAASQAASKCDGRMRCITNADRKAAAARTFKQRTTTVKPRGMKAATATGGAKAATLPAAVANPNITLDQLYFGNYPNYANSALPVVDPVGGYVPGTGIRKFVDGLPGLNAPNNLGQQLPIAVPDTTMFPGSDYYEISLREYSEQMHSDLPPVKLRGYVQTNNGTDPLTGQNTIAPAGIHYLGPIIIAQENRPVRVKFTNNLPLGSAGNLFIPTDLTYMGAGMGPNGSLYTQNRATVHLHGGATPWISDGTPHQWTVPAGENTPYTRGDSVQFVPDMFFDANGNVVPVPQCGGNITTNCYPNAVPAGLSNDPGPGSLTMFYTNQQSARLMFYHDHAYGTTRLNVYVGMAAGYLVQDPIEGILVNGGTITNGNNTVTVPAGTIPSDQIPLVIQDKSFVPPDPSSSPIYSVSIVDNGGNYTAPQITFTGGGCTVEPTAVATLGEITTGLPPVTIENAITAINLTNAGAGCTSPPDITITDSTGMGAIAYAYMANLAQQDPTWDTTLWGGPGQLWFPHVYMPNQWPASPDNYLPPSVDAGGVNPMGRWDYGMWFWPPMNTSELKHADIPCPTAAAPTQTCPGTPSALNPDAATGSVASGVPEGFMDTPVINGTAYPTITVQPKAYRLRILNAANDRTFNLSLFVADPIAVSMDGRRNTEVKMVSAAPTGGWPSYWPTDGRDGGVPDPATAGPSWIQIGTEGGLLPQPVVIPPAPVNYEYNRRSVTVLNISSHSLLLGPAERADVIVDFSRYAGTTLILYNDSPAPVPAFDARYDYYTGDPDQSASGGAPTTIAGFGPNTRTMMQIVVAGAPVPFDATPLNTALPAAFAATQPVPVVPETVYSAAYNTPLPNKYLRLQDTSLSFTPIGTTTPITEQVGLKAIQELFELNYGRMNATLGTELPFTSFNTQTTIPLAYIDPATEIIKDSSLTGSPVAILGDGTQVWQVAHNGVDTHAIHVHLFNMQLLNRVGWDGTVRPPEPNELGWKETVRMNPLENAFVALRPVKQDLPFPIPDSVRRLDPACPVGATNAGGCTNFTNIDPYTNNPVTTTNDIVNFGWEYVWHCHLLGHEENDMMRPIVFQVAPPAPSNLVAIGTNSGVNLTFTDNSASETGFTLQRADDVNFTMNMVSIPLGPQPGYGSTVAYSDTTAAPGTPYFYRVDAFSANGTSPWSNTATVQLLPIAGVSPTSLAFGNQFVNTTSTPQSVTLSNTGLGTLLISGISITGANFTDFAQNNTCGSGLAAGGSCTINVTFTPSAMGSRSAAVTIASNDSVHPTLSVGLTGTGVAPVAGAVPTSLTFGNQVLNTTSAAQTVTLSNTGTATLTFSVAFGGSNPGDFPLAGGTCGTSLNAGSNCTIGVTFKPTVAGARSASITVSTNDPLNPTLTVALAGTGVAPGVSLSPTSITFANQLVNTRSAGQTVTVTNTQTTTLTINSIALVGGNNGDFSLSTGCGSTLAAGRSCTVTLYFRPTAVGSRSTTLTITDSAVGSPQTVPMSGTGIAPVLSINPSSLSFSSPLNITSAAQAVTVTNTGTAPLTINSVTLGGTNSGQFGQTKTCGATLAAGSSCTVNVTFRPTSATSPKNATLNINVAAPGTSQSVALTGTVVAPTYTVSPTSLSFGTVLHGTSSASQTVRVTNTSAKAFLSITSISNTGPNAAEFVVQNGNCVSTLSPGVFCQFTVTFKPVLPTGAKSTTINLNVAAPGTSSSIPASGTSN